MNIQEAKSDILREAGRYGKQVCKLKNPTGEFVKVKRGYSQPDEVRSAYLDALDSLLTDGSVKQVFSNRVLNLYEVNLTTCGVSTLRNVQQRIMSEIGQSGRIYKIHGPCGEFVQFGNQSFDDLEDERILYMEALGELLHHGFLYVEHESAEMTVYGPTPAPASDLLHYEEVRQPLSSSPTVHYI